MPVLLNEEQRRKLRKIKLVASDVDGVQSDDTVSMFVVSEEEKATFGLSKAGDTLKLVPCDENGTPSDRYFQFSTGADGRIEGYRFFTGDGIAMKECLRANIPVVLITGRRSPAVRQRADDIGVRCLQGIADKVEAISVLLDEYAITWDEVLFIGNDIQDLTLMQLAGFSAVPSDATRETKTVADFIAARPGGRGAVRDIVEQLLDAKGLWEGIINRERTLG